VLLRVSGVNKYFGKNRALNDVNLEVRKGTVHCLVGENGSGKSTLTKIIAGVETPDSGSVAVSEHVLRSGNPRDSIRSGVRVIYQDLALFPNMSVADNLVFDGEEELWKFTRATGRKRRAERVLRELGVNIDPAARLGDLAAAERQIIAIARSVSSDGELIIMDEPTAALTHREIENLLETVTTLRDQGISFIFISHKLREVVSVADEVTVLRDGEVVATGRSEDFHQERITTLMTGGTVTNVDRATSPQATKTPSVAMRNVSIGKKLRNVDLALYPGVITGLAGVVGSGRTEVGLAMAGLIPLDRGAVYREGQVLKKLRANAKLQYVPEDRLTEGLFLDWSLADNVIVNDLESVLTRIRVISNSRIADLANTWINNLSIKADSAFQKVTTLSGGNQQRVLLARVLSAQPDVVVFNNPTVGVDIASRAEIHNLIRDVADRGTAVLLISDEPAELISVADEILFMTDGEITESATPDQLTENRLVEIITEGVNA